MTTVPESTFNAADVFGLISKYHRLIILGTAFGVTLFLAAAQILPKKYKSHFTLTIYAKYFQNPLIQDFMPELNDPGEMKSERESLIRQALSPGFLDFLGVKYGIYHSKDGALALLPQILERFPALRNWVGRLDFLQQPPRIGFEASADREDLLARIQIFDLSNTTFHVSFTYTDPDVTLRVTQDIYAQVIHTLLETHMSNLINIRDAIRKRLESLAYNLVASAPDPHVSISPQAVNAELQDIQNQIRALSAQYTEDHPVMKALRERENLLMRWQANASQNGSVRAAGQDSTIVGEESLPAVKDIYGDLMKKLNYLNIALEADRAHQGDYFVTVENPIYPESPLWPKKGFMALWGAALGFMGSLSIAALREYFHRTTLRAVILAEQLGIPMLGALPVIPWNLPLKLEKQN